MQFTDTSTAVNCPILSWTWVWGDGTPNGTTQNPTHTFHEWLGTAGQLQDIHRPADRHECRGDVASHDNDPAQR